MSGCRNAERPAICLCPDVERGYGPRQRLSQTFINGWLSGELTKAANNLAADPTVSEERLWRMVFTLEDEASGAYEMWRQTQ